MAEHQMEIRPIVRVLNTDLNGHKSTLIELRKIKGVSFMYANMLLKIAEIDPRVKVGYLNEKQIARIEEIAKSPLKYGAPAWLVNRRRDYETDEDLHLLGQDITFVQDNDVKRLKKIKSYRGMRHSYGQPTRGQRTKSNFRKNKGKGSLGVVRNKVAAPAAPAGKKE